MLVPRHASCDDPRPGGAGGRGPHPGTHLRSGLRRRGLRVPSEAGALEAVRQVSRAIDDGHTEVVDADLSKYFDTIPHSALITSVARRISDGQTLRLIKLWLKAPVIATDAQGNRRVSGGKKATPGTPLGGWLRRLPDIRGFRSFVYGRNGGDSTAQACFPGGTA